MNTVSRCGRLVTPVGTLARFESFFTFIRQPHIKSLHDKHFSNHGPWYITMHYHQKSPSALGNIIILTKCVS